MNTPLLIGVIAALPIEARIFRRENSDHLLLHVAGMGKERAQQAAQHLISRGANALISWGTAAGLAPNLRPGQLLLPDKIISQDHTTYPVTKSWRDHLQQALNVHLAIVNGSLVQVDKIITLVQDKQSLSAHYHAVAADMESAAIAAVAQQANLPFLAIRSIVDAADSVFPTWLQESLNPGGTIQPFTLMKKVCHNPSRLLALLQLSRDFSAAKKSLATAASICHPCTGWNF